MSLISRKNQITLPVDALREVGLKPGEVVVLAGRGRPVEALEPVVLRDRHRARGSIPRLDERRVTSSSCIGVDWCYVLTTAAGEPLVRRRCSRSSLSADRSFFSAARCAPV